MSNAKLLSRLRHFNLMAMKHGRNAKKFHKFITKGDQAYDTLVRKAPADFLARLY